MFLNKHPEILNQTVGIIEGREMTSCFVICNQIFKILVSGHTVMTERVDKNVLLYWTRGPHLAIHAAGTVLKILC